MTQLASVKLRQKLWSSASVAHCLNSWSANVLSPTYLERVQEAWQITLGCSYHGNGVRTVRLLELWQAGMLHWGLLSPTHRDKSEIKCDKDKYFNIFFDLKERKKRKCLRARDKGETKAKLVNNSRWPRGPGGVLRWDPGSQSWGSPCNATQGQDMGLWVHVKQGSWTELPTAWPQQELQLL